MKTRNKHNKPSGTQPDSPLPGNHPVVAFSFLLYSFPFLLSPFCFLLITSCAQQGSLTGGTRDTIPPRIVESIPPNFSTHFISDKISITFDEYFDLKNINQKLVVSPPMDRKPEFKVRGKSLDISLKDSLQPSRTYALNFGDALVDLNESNPLKNFQFVFSTGSEIDSMQISGKVKTIPDDKPAEDVLVMLYNGTSDSLPMKEIPLYISRTSKQGVFSLRNLAAGAYRIFSLKDANNNMLFDQPTEPIAYLDSLIIPRVERIRIDSALLKTDSLAEAPLDSLVPKQDSTPIASGKTKRRSVAGHTEETARPGYRYYPDSLLLRMFVEARPNQYLAGNERPRADQLRIRLNEKTDSLKLEFIGLPADGIEIKPEWAGDADTIDFWIADPKMAAIDTLKALLSFVVLDSLEQPRWKTDTVPFRFRPSAKTPAPGTKEFAVSCSPEKSKTLDPGKPIVFTLSLPYTSADTSKMLLTTGKDSLPLKVGFRLYPDSLRGLILNGQTVDREHPRILRLEAPFLPDSSYRLKLLPGAFTSLSGLASDSLDIRFKIKKPDDFGSIKFDINGLNQNALFELYSGPNKLVASRRLTGPVTVTFPMLAPGKYTARLILDTNANGKWDSGRYLKHIQPEQIMPFTKELNVKANWEVSETWEWNNPEN